jgi:RNA polymerase sigma-70 factor, ECF subfamily
MPDITPKKSQEFIEAYTTLADAIWRHVYFRIWNRDMAKDLMQDTFTRTWNYIRKGKKVNNLKAFLYKVANNLIIDAYRKKREISLDGLQQNGFDVESHEQLRIERDVENSNALRLVEKLEPHHRDIIVMRYVDDLSIKEIADVIGQSENVVSVRINRGMKELKKLMHIGQN